MDNRRASLYIVLLVTFIDFMGIGLIYPLFSSMLFDCSDCLVSFGTTKEIRGVYLGLLIAFMPLTQFFSSPLWGAFSDMKGRKKPLQISLAIGFLGYLVALTAIAFNSIVILLASRIIIGFSSGNMAIVQATIADLSTKEEKAKKFGLYSMASGIGFTFGPFFGGVLANWGFNLPFIFASVMTGINFISSFFFYETNHFKIERNISLSMTISSLKGAFRLKEIRVLLIASFLHNFAWSFFFEFVPVYLISYFYFSSFGIGIFYGVAGAFYAISTGLLIRPFVKIFKPSTLFFGGNLLTALTIFTFLFLPSFFWIWPLLFLIVFFVAFVTPSSMTMISDEVSKEIQGEMLGVFSSVNAAALVFSPLFSGIFIGFDSALPMWIGSSVMLLSALSLLAVYRETLFSRK